MSKVFDIFVIGGGVNGVAIARDAAGRHLSVALAEKGDLAEETSSKSTKLFHGGLRYLEYLEIGLVKHALIEREILLKNMPHISWPMRFVLPLHPDLRFENNTTVGKLLQFTMPWLKGRRPDWMIRFALFIYDHLGGRKSLPGTSRRLLKETIEGKALHSKFKNAFEYSDVWAQDARLVSLMARDAHERGAKIMTRNRVLKAYRQDDIWVIETEKDVFKAKNIINASGPWVEDTVRGVLSLKPQAAVRLVRGSHIVINQIFSHKKSYLFQGDDGRVVFALPYEEKYTLIGTTDARHESAEQSPECTLEEAEYLCNFASRYFKEEITVDDIIWKFAGVRPLFDDGAHSGSAATREYKLLLNKDGAPLLSVFGGKITTHRILAEDALEKLGYKGAWTQTAPLAGGDFDPSDRNKLIEKFATDLPKLSQYARRIFSCYGLESWVIFGRDYGEHFGAGLFATEVDHLFEHEFAQTVEDIIWRRTKLGLDMDQTMIERLAKHIEKNK